MTVARTHSFIPTQYTVAGGVNVTVPTAKRWLIKRFTMFNDSGATRTVSLNIKVGGTVVRCVYITSLANNTSLDKELYIVVNATDVVQATSSAAGVTVNVSGIELAV